MIVAQGRLLVAQWRILAAQGNIICFEKSDTEEMSQKDQVMTPSKPSKILSVTQEGLKWLWEEY